MMLSTKEYQQRLAYKMSKAFIEELFEKTGMHATIKIDNLKMVPTEKGPINKIISLDILENSLIKVVPIPLEKNPMRTPSRKGEYVEVRCVFCHIACKVLGFSLVAVARHIKRDHTSIIHMNKRAEQLLETDERFRNFYKIIFDALNKEQHVDAV